MPISFSIAGIRVVDKPKPNLLSRKNNPGNQNTQQNAKEPNAANNSNNEETQNVSNAVISQSHQASVPKPSQDNNNNSQSNPTTAPKVSQDKIIHHHHNKYPGSGKLTILQKKGKTGYSKSIIRRVPVYNEDYDSSDDEEEEGKNTAAAATAVEDIYIHPRLLLQTDEEILMDQLDAEITRQEEEELLDKWNNEILEQEEADLMKRLSINIEQAEYLENCAANKPSVVALVEDINEPEESSSMLSVQVPKIDSPSKLVFQPAFGESCPSIPNGVEITKEIDFCKASIKLPCYLDQELKIQTFTRAEFYTCVVQPFEQDVMSETEKSLYGWDVRLEVSSEDIFSYVLEARGPREALDEFKKQVELWVQARIRLINSYLLLQDGASVVITTGVNPRLNDGEIRTEKKKYQERVVSWTEKKFGWTADQGSRETETSLRGWKVRVQFKADPENCVISAKGTPEMLKQLEESTKNWVETESSYAPHSFESSSLQPSSSGADMRKLRMTFRLTRYLPLGFTSRVMKTTKTQATPTQYSNCGVWLSGIKDGTKLAEMMGGPHVFERGCSLLAIDGKECNTPQDVKNIYSEAKDKASNSVSMTVCLSRYTDFEAIPDFVDLLTPSRLDGKPFHLGDYKKLESVETRAMEEQPKQPRVQQQQGTQQKRKLQQRQQHAQQQEQPYVPETIPTTSDDNQIGHEVWIPRILGNDMSIEIEVMFSSAESLGGTCGGVRVEGGGVVLFQPKPNGQLLRVLGNASNFNVVLWKLNGLIVQDLKHLQELVKEAKQDGKDLQCVLVLHEGSDLSQLDYSKLVSGGGPNPRRRNGDTRSLVNQLPPPENSLVMADDKVTSEEPEAEVDFSGEWSLPLDSSSSSDDGSEGSALVTLKRKKNKKNISDDSSEESALVTLKRKINKKTTDGSTKKSTASKASATKTTTKMATQSQKPKSKNASTALVHEKDKYQTPKTKVSESNKTATNTASKPGKRVAESVVADEPRIPKKARAIPTTKKTVSVRSASSSTPSANPSQAATLGEMRQISRLEKTNAQKAKSALPAKQKRVPVTQPIGQPAGKKHKAISREVVNKSAARQVSQPAIPRRKSNGPAGSGLFEENEVEFLSSQPIGAFFKTEESKCKVFSVFKKGNAKKKNIMPGAIAVAISIAGTRQDISTHDELREAHERARERRSKIHIFFVNSDVLFHTLDPNSDQDWTECGVWTGRYEGGWAGGVRTKKGVASLQSDPTPGKPRASCIKDPSTPRERRKVKFSDCNAVKIFVVGSATDQWQDPAAISNKVETKSQPRSPADILKDAVMNQRYTNLIEILETGMTSDADVLNHILPRHYDYVKKAASNDRGREKEWQAKKKVIAIYRSMCMYIEQAMKLKYTRVFQVVVKSVELKKKPKSVTLGRTEMLNGRVCIKHGNDLQELGSLPKIPTKTFVSYDGSDHRDFLASYNLKLKLDRRDLFIDFREGVGEDAVPAAKLGSVAIPLEKIDQRCPVDESLSVREDFMIPAGSIISEGTVTIEFKRLKIEKDFTKQQREALIKSLSMQISFIERFNAGFGGGRMKLTANIQSVENATPLHAAIILNDEHMVKQLLSLGADPRAKSSYGTPSNQASKQKDGTKEKLQNLINNGKPFSETEPFQQLYEKHSRIECLLKSKEATPEGLPDNLEKSNEDKVYSGGASGASEEKRRIEILEDIFSEAPKAAGGFEDALEAGKNFVGGMLRLKYSKQCPNVRSVEQFITDAIRRKIVVSISPTKFRLGTAAGSQDHDTVKKKKEAELPETQLDWMLPDKKRVCRNYDSERGCKFDHRCRFAHIHRVPKDQTVRLVLESKELLKVRKDRFVLDKEHVRHLHLDGWFTAGYYNPNSLSRSTYFYSEGGKGKVNGFGVNWYRTLPEAKEALQRVLTLFRLSKRRYRDIVFCEKSQNHQTLTSQSNGHNLELPVLEDIYWMDKVAEFLDSIEDRNSWTAEARFGSTIGRQLTIFLDPDDVYTLERKGFHTSAFADRQYNKIIYVEGGNSKINDQGLHWYGSESEARNALEPVVSASRKRSAAK